MEPDSFEGTAGRTLQDSTPWWPPIPVRARGRTEHRHGAPRRRRVRAVRLLRVRHRDTDVRSSRRRRPALQQLPHDGVVLPHSRLPAHRAQPSRQRHGSHRRVLVRLPRLRRDDAEGERVPVRDPRQPRLRQLRRRQVASRTRQRDGHRRMSCTLAARAWLRSVLRVHGRRDRPVSPRSRARQPPDRSAPHAGGGVPPHRGSGRPGHQLHQGPASSRARASLLPLLHTGRVPRSASGAEAVPRSVQGEVRPGLGSLARRDL